MVHSTSDDDNRVVLKAIIPGCDEYQQDYINASYVDVSFSVQATLALRKSLYVFVHMQGYSKPAAFIATQG